MQIRRRIFNSAAFKYVNDRFSVPSPYYYRTRRRQLIKLCLIKQSLIKLKLIKLCHLSIEIPKNSKQAPLTSSG